MAPALAPFTISLLLEGPFHQFLVPGGPFSLVSLSVEGPFHRCPCHRRDPFTGLPVTGGTLSSVSPSLEGHVDNIEASCCKHSVDSPCPGLHTKPGCHHSAAAVFCLACTLGMAAQSILLAPHWLCQCFKFYSGRCRHVTI